MNSNSETPESIEFLEAEARKLEESATAAFTAESAAIFTEAARKFRDRVSARRPAAVSTPEGEADKGEPQVVEEVVYRHSNSKSEQRWRKRSGHWFTRISDEPWEDIGSASNLDRCVKLQTLIPVSATIPEAAAAAKDPWEPILEKWLDTRGDIVTAEDFAKRCFDAGVAHAAHDRQPPQAVEQLDPDLLAVLNEPWKRSLINYPMHPTFDHKSFRDGYELGLKGRSVAVPAPIPAESAAVPATPERKP